MVTLDCKARGPGLLAGDRKNDEIGDDHDEIVNKYLPYIIKSCVIIRVPCRFHLY